MRPIFSESRSQGASEKNHAFATTNLATCYQLGRGTEIDHVKAIYLLNKAIKLGDDMAAFNLGQTYLLGVGVKQDEIKGWNILESLATKGNEHARVFINDLIKKGYKIPKECNANNDNVVDNNDVDKTAQYAIDHAPECIICDSKVLALYNSVRTGDNSAKAELMEMAGNQMNREAMNALRKLGLIAQDIDENFKRGTIEYIANAWKTYNVEPLYVACS